ncbi:hypothetical protein L6164_013514 [Bauhinia variegata]|uniref:Uncharacterized protein n=1 Tax=Bauhinia variegata TaxID=167791 RepID=A0ACB9NJB6_BAUVA|nr:hypothetical protein L6164_013514 [Bauhinia variegata]
MEAQAVVRGLLLKEEDKSLTTNRFATDSVVEIRGSDGLAGLECFLNIARALGMGSCFSGDGSPRPLPCGSESPSDGGKWRKRLRNSSSFDYKIELRLHRVPGRMFLNGSSEVASLFSKQGRKGINQDAMLVWENFSSKDTIFCGVFDGHGPYGHRVAKKVRDSFPLKLSAELELHYKNKNGAIDWNYSSCLDQTWQDLVIGNVGDSRAILGTRDHSGSLTAVPLTIDLKPNLPKEAERIKLARGRVFALQNEPEVSRVWLPNANSPGLAMARAFGDFCLKDYGLISVPDISYHRITEKDEFVVLATDGIWDVLSNKEVVDIVAACTRASAARTLVETAVQSWKTKYPTSKVDDCAVVCLFLDAEADFKSALDNDSPRAPLDQSDFSPRGAAADSLVNSSRLSRTAPEHSPLLEDGKVGA